MARCLAMVAVVQQVCGQDIFLSVRVKFDGHGHDHGFQPGHHRPTCHDPPSLPKPSSPNSTNVFMAQCELAAPGWPIFNTADELQSDSEWAQYFDTVYGEIPSFGYPICVGAFTQIAVRGGLQITANPQDCVDSTVDDGTLIHAMTRGFEPPQNLVTHIYSSRNVRHAVPANMWVEIQHLHSIIDMGEAWYFLEFGSAVWFNVGNTIVFKDHPDASEYFLSTKCHEMHIFSPHTECEFDFTQWYKEARKQKYTSIQFTDHYDCGCGVEGPSSWKHKRRLCHTEIIQLDALCNKGGCASGSYKAGWAAQRDCDCDSSKEYSNCKGFGL